MLSNYATCGIMAEGTCTSVTFKQVIPVTEPLESIAIDIIGQLTQRKGEKRAGAVIRDRYKRLTRVVPTSKMTATHTATMFLDHLTVPFGITRFPLMGTGSHFVSKVLPSRCRFLEVKHMKTTDFHSQTSKKVPGTQQNDCHAHTAIRHTPGKAGYIC